MNSSYEVVLGEVIRRGRPGSVSWEYHIGDGGYVEMEVNEDPI